MKELSAFVVPVKRDSVSTQSKSALSSAVTLPNCKRSWQSSIFPSSPSDWFFDSPRFDCECSSPFLLIIGLFGTGLLRLFYPTYYHWTLICAHLLVRAQLTKHIAHYCLPIDLCSCNQLFLPKTTRSKCPSMNQVPIVTSKYGK